MQLSERDACPNCSPCVPLDLKKPQRVLEHIGSHILKDQNINHDAEPCGLCLRPSSLCHFWVGKGKGTTGKPRIMKSTCVNSLRFNYATAAKSTEASLCSNIPISCSLCSKDDPAVWRYNMAAHFRKKHPSVAIEPYKHLWELSNFEKHQMNIIWTNQQKVPKTRKKKSTALVISESHSSRSSLAVT